MLGRVTWSRSTEEQRGKVEREEREADKKKRQRGSRIQKILGPACPTMIMITVHSHEQFSAKKPETPMKTQGVAPEAVGRRERDIHPPPGSVGHNLAQGNLLCFLLETCPSNVFSAETLSEGF